MYIYAVKFEQDCLIGTMFCVFKLTYEQKDKDTNDDDEGSVSIRCNGSDQPRLEKFAPSTEATTEITP